MTRCAETLRVYLHPCHTQHMNTSYRVTNAAGEIIGIFPKGDLRSVKALVEANPGAQVKAVVTADSPCATHPSFEAHNCPSCGTGVTL